MEEGMLRAALLILDSDSLSDAWPPCLVDADSDECLCGPCVRWAEVLRIRSRLHLLLS